MDERVIDYVVDRAADEFVVAVLALLQEYCNRGPMGHKSQTDVHRRGDTRDIVENHS